MDHHRKHPEGGVIYRCSTHGEKGHLGCGEEKIDGYQCRGRTHFLCGACADKLEEDLEDLEEPSAASGAIGAIMDP